MTTQTTQHPPGATLHLGGDAWAAPALEPLLTPLDATTPYPGNPRRHDQDQITGSVRDHGLYQGIVIQSSTGHTIVGNGRRQALVDLGASMVPTSVMDVEDTQAAAIVARDNRTSDLGGYDAPELLALLTAVEGDGVPAALLGFDDAALAVLRRQAEAEAVFTVGTEHLVDEFRAISGQDPSPYEAVYARKTTVFLRDDAAIGDFCAKLGIESPLGADLNWPPDWTPADRRKRRDDEDG